MTEEEFLEQREIHIGFLVKYQDFSRSEAELCVDVLIGHPAIHENMMTYSSLEDMVTLLDAETK